MSSPPTVSTWSLNEQLTLSGALTALGCTAEALVARRGRDATSTSTSSYDDGGMVLTTIMTTLEAIDNLLAFIDNNKIAGLDHQSPSIEAPSGESKSASNTHHSHTTPADKTQRQGQLLLYLTLSYSTHLLCRNLS